MELLAVVVIIGVLAAVVIPRIGGQTKLAKDRVCRQYAADLNSAIERFQCDSGAWPSTLDELRPDYYDQELPACPATKLPYTIDAASHRVSDHAHP